MLAGGNVYVASSESYDATSVRKNESRCQYGIQYKSGGFFARRPTAEKEYLLQGHEE
jgi:hypothetical protein